MTHSPLYSLGAGLMIGGIFILCAIAPAKAQDAHLPHPDDREITNAACRFDNSDEGIRQAVCVFIYSDGTEERYWQPVTIEDGVIAVLEIEGNGG